MQLSFTEENYLKAIYYLQLQSEENAVAVNEIANRMQTRPATVTDMLRKLSEKALIDYQKYKKTRLSTLGTECALQVVRNHRLWEVFLHEKLNFSWDEVHEVAEELEHIRSPKLIEKLDEFLGFPRFDPHGDPIPTASGNMEPASRMSLAEAATNTPFRLVGLKDTSSEFLQFLERFGLAIGTGVQVKERLDYDNSCLVKIGTGETVMFPSAVADKLLVVQASAKAL